MLVDSPKESPISRWVYCDENTNTHIIHPENIQTFWHVNLPEKTRRLTHSAIHWWHLMRRWMAQKDICSRPRRDRQLAITKMTVSLPLESWQTMSLSGENDIKSGKRERKELLVHHKKISILSIKFWNGSPVIKSSWDSGMMTNRIFDDSRFLLSRAAKEKTFTSLRRWDGGTWNLIAFSTHAVAGERDESRKIFRSKE